MARKNAFTRVVIVNQAFKESISNMTIEELRKKEHELIKRKAYEHASYVSRMIISRKANMGVRYAGSSK